MSVCKAITKLTAKTNRYPVCMHRVSTESRHRLRGAHTGDHTRRRKMRRGERTQRHLTGNATLCSHIVEHWGTGSSPLCTVCQRSRHVLFTAHGYCGLSKYAPSTHSGRRATHHHGSRGTRIRPSHNHGNLYTLYSETACLPHDASSPVRVAVRIFILYFKYSCNARRIKRWLHQNSPRVIMSGNEYCNCPDVQ